MLGKAHIFRPGPTAEPTAHRLCLRGIFYHKTPADSMANLKSNLRFVLRFCPFSLRAFSTKNAENFSSFDEDKSLAFQLMDRV